MSDLLRSALTEEADRRLAGAAVPPVGAVHARMRRVSRRQHAWGAPTVAALVVIALALGTAYSLHPLTNRTTPAVVVPPAPKLGSIIPPLVVRTRLGAPSGHVNGPAVPAADVLAVSPTRQDGLFLRTVGVERPHSTPDAQGRPRVERCVYTYTDPGAAVLEGGCDWTAPVTPRASATPVTVQMLGAPGRTWLRGSAPAGTAAVLLRAGAHKDRVVATAAAGPAWGEQPYYVAWWPRTGTDVIALDRTGHELGRTRLPSDVAVRRAPGDPELGTMETPLDAHRFIPMGLTDVVPPSRVDLLARTRLSDTVTLMTIGYQVAGTACWSTYVQDYGGAPAATGGDLACGAVNQKPQTGIGVQRSYHSGAGKPQEQQLTGSAPPGTVRIRLSSVGRTSASFRAYDGGSRWQHRAYFIASWPSAAATRIEAFDREGRLLATTADRGLNPHAFDADYLTAQASCLRRAGAIVTETPQGHGTPPAYSIAPGQLSAAQMRAAEDACETEADNATR